jgi:putative acetyltransferase
VAAVAAVAAASYQAGFAGILEPEVLAARGEAFFAPRLAEAGARLRIVERLGRVLGFCLMTEGHIDMLFVAPEGQGSGAGSALLVDAEVRGACSLECFAANRAARDYYERHGWRVASAYRRDFAGRLRDFVRYEKP